MDLGLGSKVQILKTFEVFFYWRPMFKVVSIEASEIQSFSKVFEVL